MYPTIFLLLNTNYWNADAILFNYRSVRKNLASLQVSKFLNQKMYDFVGPIFTTPKPSSTWWGHNYKSLKSSILSIMLTTFNRIRDIPNVNFNKECTLQTQLRCTFQYLSYI